jgi:hypothetical protein
VLIALSGIVWIEVALRHYERATDHERQGVIGFHYSQPEWGFEYRPGGRRMERWSFNIPAGVTLILLTASAVIGAWRLRKTLGIWGVVGLVSIHFFAGLAFLAFTFLMWVQAASVFI